MNVLVYVFDSLRADHLSCYGYDRQTSPVLDTLASEGVLFEQCISPSTWTRPVAASLLTGLYPLVHGNRGLNDALNPPYPTFPEYLSDAGYETMAIGVMANIQSNWGFDGGFDTYVDLSEQETLEQLEEMQDTSLKLTSAGDITRGFERWLEENWADEPFFAMMWSYETHTPFEPPEGFRSYVDSDYDGPVDGGSDSFGDISTPKDRRHLVGLYDSAIRYNDHCLGKIRKVLRQRGLYEDTLIICIGDHGEGLGERPGFYGHGVTPYEELIHVPCIVRTPNDVSGFRVPELVSLVDLYPTIIEATDIDSDSRAMQAVQGSSLAPALSGETIEGSERVFVDGKTYESKERYLAVRTPEYKYISVEEGDSGGVQGYAQLLRSAVASGRIIDVLRHPLFYYRRHTSSSSEYLFDLETDPDENRSIADEKFATKAELESHLDDWVTACQELKRFLNVETDAVSIDEQTEAKLRRLGYFE